MGYLGWAVIQDQQPSLSASLEELVADLRSRVDQAWLGPADTVRVLAALLRATGWQLAAPDLPRDRGALEAHLLESGNLASALILQGYILLEWIEGSDSSKS